MPAQLTFVINQGVLHGVVNGQAIHIRAASGGGGGAIDRRGHLKMPEDARAVNNPLSASQKANSGKGVRGGSLPWGRYAIQAPAKHPRLGRAAFLQPVEPSRMMGRGGFFIHGRGKHGSDGCIVPLDPRQFHLLMDGLAKDGGGKLVVQGIVDEMNVGGTALA